MSTLAFSSRTLGFFELSGIIFIHEFRWASISLHLYRKLMLVYELIEAVLDSGLRVVRRNASGYSS